METLLRRLLEIGTLSRNDTARHRDTARRESARARDTAGRESARGRDTARDRNIA